MENKTLMTDFYELTQAQTYFNEGLKDTIVYFDLFCRRNPFEGGYQISAGLDEVIDYIKHFKFGKREIKYLRSLNMFSEEFLDYLANLRFKGDIYAVEDGTVLFPKEPAITVKADVITAQILETALLAAQNYGSLVTTASKRITSAADGIPVMEFGARRARGIDAAILGSKYAYIGGCVGTSNTYAGMKFGIPVLGTMAHSLIQLKEVEYDAFLMYAKSNPDNCVFLVDTYDVLRSGVPNAIKVANEYLTPNGYKFKGIRIDSGELAYLSKEAKKMLIEAGYPDAKVCLSNSIDEYTLSALKEEHAIIENLGCGEKMIASKEIMGMVYKLAAVEEDGKIVPRIKISEDEDKTTNPGYKKVYRFYDKEKGIAIGDVIAMADEIIPDDKYTLVHPTENWKTKTIRNYVKRELQIPIFKDGKLVYRVPSLKARREYCQKEIETIYEEVRSIHKPYKYIVDLSDEVREEKERLIRFYIDNIPNPEDPPKVFTK